MSSTEQSPNEQAGRDDIGAPDPTAGQAGDGPTQGGPGGTPAGDNEGEGADKSTDR